MLNDFRYALRILLKNPGFTVVATLALALGIGANTAIFSVVNTVLLRPLQLREPEQLVAIFGAFRGGIKRASVSPADFKDYRDQNQVFEQLAAAVSVSSPVNLTGSGEPERLTSALVTANYFEALGVRPGLGRGFVSSDEHAGEIRKVILSHGFWLRRFGGDQSAVGKELVLDGKSCTVVGVMLTDFRFPRLVDLWAPLPLYSPDMSSNRGAHFLRPVARLKRGVRLAQAQAEVDTISARLEAQYPDTNTAKGLRLVLLHEQIVGNIRPALWVMMGAVGFVLLIACSNVASLLLSRAASRHREIAIRSVLGAGRRRIVRLVLVESVVLSLIGGALGALLGLWGKDALLLANPSNIPRLQETRFDAGILAFAFLLSLLTGLIFGWIPALQISRFNLNASLKEGSQAAVGGGRVRRWHRALVVTEVALALVLLIGAGLMIRSFRRLIRISPGFTPEGLLTFQINLPDSKYNREQAGRFFQQITQRIGNLPGVKSVGMVTTLPLGGLGNDNPFTILERPPQDPRLKVTADFRRVDHRYFRTMEIPLLSGRHFTEQEARESIPVVVVSQSLAVRFFPNENPLGRHLMLGESEPCEIVGIVGDVGHRALEVDVYQAMYVPSMRVHESSLAVRTTVNPMSLAGAIRNEILAVDMDQPISNMRPMNDLLFNSMASRRFSMWLLNLFSAIALILAAIGVYGVISYSVTQRTREIGVRMALGASRYEVFGLVLKQGMLTGLGGVAAGLVLAFGVTRLMSRLLFGVSATDPLTFALIALMFVLVTLLACYLPASRATRVDPIVALRYE